MNDEIPRTQPVALRVIRWALMIPVAVIAWYIAFFLSLALLLLMSRWCPADQVVSNMCIAPWYRFASKAMVAVGAAMAAIFVMFACTATAPTHKRPAAIVTFVGGTITAAVMGLATRDYLALGGAIVGGAAALWILLRRSTAQSPSDNSIGRRLVE